MWKYIKRYLHFMVLAALCMVCEILVDLLQPSLMTTIVDDGVLGLNNGGVGDMNVILTYGLFMLGLVILGGLGGAFCGVFGNIASENAGNMMRKDGFCRIMRFSFPQVDRFGAGALITRVTNDITQVQNMLLQMVRGAIRTSIMFLGSIYFMFRLYPQFGIIVLCALPFALCVVLLCLRKATPHFSEMQEQLDHVNAILQEDISGIRIIKACVRETYEKLRFGKTNEKLISSQLRVLVIFAFMSPVMNALMYIVVIAILLIGSVQINGGGATPGAIMGAITYTTQLLNSVLGLVMLFQNISRGMVSWNRVREILTSDPDLKDGSFTGETEEKGRIEFRDVSFAYPGTGEPILEHINLNITPGETVAIMGATGCGKTTLVNLIPRFYDVTSGQILVDGVDVRDYNQQALRDKISIALQNCELYSTSIKENISWGKPGATEEEIRAAAIVAQANDFILNTPGGYETVVAERGMSLSGGQRQRVSIARAVLKNAEILIFDDSTSALDLKTETNLYNALDALSTSGTKIIVAQRIASVRRADRIILLEGGTIAACGSHEELLQKCAIYQDIYHSQIGNEVDDDE